MTQQMCSKLSLRFQVKIVALINLLWTTILILIELTLISYYGMSGIRDLNPELSEAVLDQNVECTYHLYYKYSCRKVGNHSTTSTAKSSGTNNLIGTNPGPYEQLQNNGFPEISPDVFISMVWISSWLVDVGFSVLLYNAVNKESRGKCLVWYYFRLIIFLFRLFFLIIYTIVGLSLWSKIPVFVFFIYRVYSLWIVKKYINELKLKRANAKQSGELGSIAPVPSKNENNANHVSQKSLKEIESCSESNSQQQQQQQQLDLVLDMNKKIKMRTARRQSAPFLVFNI